MNINFKCTHGPLDVNGVRVRALNISSSEDINTARRMIDQALYTLYERALEAEQAEQAEEYAEAESLVMK